MARKKQIAIPHGRKEIQNMKNKKKFMRQAIAFLIVWFCSGAAWTAYQTGHKVWGIGFSLLSYLYFVITKQKQVNNSAIK